MSPFFAKGKDVQRQTSALVEEYARRGLLQRIDANRDVEEVDASVTPILEELSAGSRT